jgi:hypothetical protein
MIIILDTNIFQQDYFMKSRFTVLIDYLHRTQSQIALPKIVLDELAANFKRDLENRLKVYHRNRGNLEALLFDPLQKEQEINTSNETARYIEMVLHTLQIRKDYLFPLRPEYLDDVVYRAINRIPPCSDRGEEIRDAIIWCSVKDITRELGEGRALFISNNPKQFTDGSGGLHKVLSDEATSEGLTIQYLTSLEDFAREHASLIDFITKEWLAQNIDFTKVVESIRSRLEAALGLKLPSGIIDGKSYTRNTRLAGGDLQVGDFYVNELTDGSYRIEAVLQGDLQFELEVQNIRSDFPVMSTGTSGSGMYIPTTFPVTFSDSASPIIWPDETWERVHPTVKVTIDVLIRNKVVEKWTVIDFTIDSPWRYTVVSG